jgi:hypothetical protein
MSSRLRTKASPVVSSDDRNGGAKSVRCMSADARAVTMRRQDYL